MLEKIKKSPSMTTKQTTFKALKKERQAGEEIDDVAFKALVNDNITNPCEALKAMRRISFQASGDTWYAGDHSASDFDKIDKLIRSVYINRCGK